MARCGRPSVAGVVALVAGLAAISLLATHASADACASVDCGADAYCLAREDGPPVCLCNYAGYAFNHTSKTCTGEWWGCGRAVGVWCVAQDGQAQCQCPGLYIMQNGTCTDGLLQTVVQVEGRDSMDLLSFESPVPMPLATGAIACSSISDLGGSTTKIQVGWTGYADFTAGKGMCKSVSFHADPLCAENPGLTIARPAMLRNAFPDTKA
ncbi:unnamed protein product [Closterium sp. Yama58-4]|nr:unnamed protein product [Closterium sp. Yama58-4]